MKWRAGKIILLVALVMLGVAGFFVWSGGLAIVRLYREYLSQDIADKKYSYQDFTDRGPKEMLHGYYAGSMGESVYIWTLGGLRRFRHRQTTSVYYYSDVCGVIGRMVEAKAARKEADSLKSEPLMTFDLVQWRDMMRRGDYMWVKRVGEGEESRIIDKILAINNYHYPIRGITLTECKER